MNKQIIQEKKSTKKQLIKEILETVRTYEKIYNEIDRDKSHSYQLGYTETNREYLIRDIKRVIEQYDN